MFRPQISGLTPPSSRSCLPQHKNASILPSCHLKVAKSMIQAGKGLILIVFCHSEPWMTCGTMAFSCVNMPYEPILWPVWASSSMPTSVRPNFFFVFLVILWCGVGLGGSWMTCLFFSVRPRLCKSFIARLSHVVCRGAKKTHRIRFLRSIPRRLCIKGGVRNILLKLNGQKKPEPFFLGKHQTS